MARQPAGMGDWTDIVKCLKPVVQQPAGNLPSNAGGDGEGLGGGDGQGGGDQPKGPKQASQPVGPGGQDILPATSGPVQGPQPKPKQTQVQKPDIPGLPEEAQKWQEKKLSMTLINNMLIQNMLKKLQMRSFL